MTDDPFRHFEQQFWSHEVLQHHIPMLREDALEFLAERTAPVPEPRVPVVVATRDGYRIAMCSTAGEAWA